jgi:DNA-binding response OmpR family regulator
VKDLKILIVDDESKIRNVIKGYAELNGYEVIEASDGLQAIEKVKKEDVKLVIMDIMMPNLDGFSATKQIKKIKDIPVIVLSARAEEYDKLHAFDIGADDYVSKPFSPKELMARIAVLLKRNYEKKSTFKYEGLEIDFEGRNVFVDGEKVMMTPKEYDLLFYLAKHNGIVVSRDKLLEEVWGFDFIGEDRTVDTHVKTLRSHLGNYRDLIVTVRGVGYKFENN